MEYGGLPPFSLLHLGAASPSGVRRLDIDVVSDDCRSPSRPFYEDGANTLHSRLRRCTKVHQGKRRQAAVLHELRCPARRHFFSCLPTEDGSLWEDVL